MWFNLITRKRMFCRLKQRFLRLKYISRTIFVAAGVNFININQHYRYKFFIRTSFFYVHVTRKKLPKRHWYEKTAQKTLMKLTAGVSNLLNVQTCRTSHQNWEVCTCYTIKPWVGNLTMHFPVYESSSAPSLL